MPLRLQRVGGGLCDGHAFSTQVGVAGHGTRDGLHDGKRLRLLGLRGQAESDDASESKGGAWTGDAFHRIVSPLRSMPLTKAGRR